MAKTIQTVEDGYKALEAAGIRVWRAAKEVREHPVRVYDPRRKGYCVLVGGYHDDSAEFVDVDDHGVSGAFKTQVRKVLAADLAARRAGGAS